MADNDYPEDVTLLSRDAADGLLLDHITTREECDFWEQKYIGEAHNWLDQHKPKDILNQAFMLKLHKKMFGEVWKWAGQLRADEANIGNVPRWRMETDLKNLCDDVKAWIENETFPPDEICVRFHHRLVFIHLFENGNGRHARLMADLLATNVLGQPPFTWGGADLTKVSTSRNRYIAALKVADKYYDDYGPLLKLARS